MSRLCQTSRASTHIQQQDSKCHQRSRRACLVVYASALQPQVLLPLVSTSSVVFAAGSGSRQIRFLVASIRSGVASFGMEQHALW